MGRAKEIILKPISSKVANEFVKRNHYSGSVMQNSTLHFGCFLDDQLHGVMQYGNPIDKRNSLSMFNYDKKDFNKHWNEFLELNRMAFDDYLPKYSESRCISVSLKLIKKHYPHIKWIISFADGCQCGDGTIYRASGFGLYNIGKNSTIIEFPDGYKTTNLSITNSPSLKRQLCQKYGIENDGKSSWLSFKAVGAKLKAGFQIKYIYFLDPSYKEFLKLKELDFSEIDNYNAGMYRGKKISISERKNADEA